MIGAAGQVIYYLGVIQRSVQSEPQYICGTSLVRAEGNAQRAAQVAHVWCRRARELIGASSSAAHFRGRRVIGRGSPSADHPPATGRKPPARRSRNRSRHQAGIAGHGWSAVGDQTGCASDDRVVAADGDGPPAKIKRITPSHGARNASSQGTSGQVVRGPAATKQALHGCAAR
jgi:hypothetical protein